MVDARPFMLGYRNYYRVCPCPGPRAAQEQAMSHLVRRFQGHDIVACVFRGVVSLSGWGFLA